MRGERGERRELSGVITKGDEKDKGREKGQAANGGRERKIHKVERRLRGCEVHSGEKPEEVFEG